MKYTDVKTMLDSIKTTYNVPFTYYSFPEKEAPELPYLVFYYPSSRNFPASDGVYARIEELTIELYTENKDFALEANVESVLDSYHIVWDKSEDYIESEHMFMITYETEIYIDGEQD